MNLKLLKMIVERQELFIKTVFTKKQLGAAKKYIHGERLSLSERHQLYTTIKNKVHAIESVCKDNKEFYIYGKIPEERLPKAKEILEQYPRAFIAGSYLWKKDAKDIDLFIIQKRGYTEQKKENLHIIRLTERKLNEPLFAAATKIAISNFPIRTEPEKGTIKMKDLMAEYHEATIEILDNQDREITRSLIFNYYLLVHDSLLDGKKLHEITSEIKLKDLEQMVKELLLHLYKKSYLYVALHNYIQKLKSAIQTEKNTEHLKRYKTLYEDIIYAS